MNWFYLENGQQGGPVAEKALKELERVGRIGPESLVWREGMSEWQPLEKVIPTPVPPPPVFEGTSAVCVECQQEFPLTSLVVIKRRPVCAACKPRFLQRLREGAAPVGAEVWQSGGEVVVSRDGQLPDRCVKCNAPAEGYRLKRKLYWHPTWVYILILSPLVYIVVAAITTKNSVVEIGLCDRHRRRRRRGIWWSWFCVPLGIACFFLPAVAPNIESLWIFMGFVLLLIGLVGVMGFSQSVRAARIEKEFIRLHGTSSTFRDELPEWR